MLGRPGLNFPNSDALEITGPRSDGADEAVAAAECDALDAVSPRAGVNSKEFSSFATREGGHEWKELHRSKSVCLFTSRRWLLSQPTMA